MPGWRVGQQVSASPGTELTNAGAWERLWGDAGGNPPGFDLELALRAGWSGNGFKGD